LVTPIWSTLSVFSAESSHLTNHSHMTIKHNQPLISPANGTEPILHSLGMLKNGVGHLPSRIHDGWLFLNEFHLLWIPIQYRGEAVKAMMNNVHCTVCIGGEGGSVIFIRLPIDQVSPKIPMLCNITYLKINIEQSIP
jgi:hypothetical protein